MQWGTVPLDILLIREVIPNNCDYRHLSYKLQYEVWELQRLRHFTGLNSVCQNSCLPETSECDFFWQQGLCRCSSQEEGMLAWCGPGILIRKPYRETVRGKGHENKEAEIVVMLAWAKEHWGLPDTPLLEKKAWTGSSQRLCKEQILLTPWFWTLGILNNVKNKCLLF